jgi:hypothetical protein
MVLYEILWMPGANAREVRNFRAGEDFWLALTGIMTQVLTTSGAPYVSMIRTMKRASCEWESPKPAPSDPRACVSHERAAP